MHKQTFGVHILSVVEVPSSPGTIRSPSVHTVYAVQEVEPGVDEYESGPQFVQSLVLAPVSPLTVSTLDH